MINMHSKFDNMHKNGMVYALVYINNIIITYRNFMLSSTYKRGQHMATSNAWIQTDVASIFHLF